MGVCAGARDGGCAGAWVDVSEGRGDVMGLGMRSYVLDGQREERDSSRCVDWVEALEGVGRWHVLWCLAAGLCVHEFVGHYI